LDDLLQNRATLLIALNTGAGTATQHLGDVIAAAKYYEQAVHYANSIGLPPHLSFDPYYKLGSVLLTLGNISGAIVADETAVSLSESSILAWRNLGHAYYAKADMLVMKQNTFPGADVFKRAEEAYERVALLAVDESTADSEQSAQQDPSYLLANTLMLKARANWPIQSRGLWMEGNSLASRAAHAQDEAVAYSAAGGAVKLYTAFIEKVQPIAVSGEEMGIASKAIASANYGEPLPPPTPPLSLVNLHPSLCPML
jgi:tetratricopeptide (TPR) repeat protein